MITPWNYGNVSQSIYPDYTFPLDDYLSLNDPIPVSFKGQYMHYSSQGTFRTFPDLTTYSPVTELMNLLGGTVISDNGKISVNYQQRAFTLDPKKQIVWKSRTYYPIKEIVSALGLKLATQRNEQATDTWIEIEIRE